MNTQTTMTVQVSRRYEAPAERVFDAWLDADRMSRWMFGPAIRDEEVLRLSIDPHVGGTFSFLVRRQGTEIDHVGTYLEIDRPRRLAFTWGTADALPDTSRVTIDIAADGGGCILTLTHDMDSKWADYKARTESGWRTILDSLERGVRD